MYCKDKNNSKKSYALCLNEPGDSEIVKDNNFCNVCNCTKKQIDERKNKNSKNNSLCNKKTSDCPNLFYQADGTITKN